VYSPAIDAIAGSVPPVSWFKNFLLNLFQESKDCGWCFPAIESIAGVHIVEFYRFRDVFSRYRIYHFEDFTCILPLSIDSGKTHHKSPAHSLVFRGFFAKVFADFQGWLCHKAHIYLENQSVCPLVRIGTPHPLSREFDGERSHNSDDWRKGLTLCLLCGVSKIREKYIKKGIKN
jgi:hypothetical protein